MANYFGPCCDHSPDQELLTGQRRRQRGSEQPAEKLQLRVNAEQGTVRWRFRIEVADKTVPGTDLDMTGGTVGAVDEHRADRRGEWIAHR